MQLKTVNLEESVSDKIFDINRNMFLNTQMSGLSTLISDGGDHKTHFQRFSEKMLQSASKPMKFFLTTTIKEDRANGAHK